MEATFSKVGADPNLLVVGCASGVSSGQSGLVLTILLSLSPNEWECNLL